MPELKTMLKEIFYMYSEYRKENAITNGEFIGWSLFAVFYSMILLDFLRNFGIIQIIKP